MALPSFVNCIKRCLNALTTLASKSLSVVAVQTMSGRFATRPTTFPLESLSTWTMQLNTGMFAGTVLKFMDGFGSFMLHLLFAIVEWVCLGCKHPGTRFQA